MLVEAKVVKLQYDVNTLIIVKNYISVFIFGFTSYCNFTTFASTNLAEDEYENYNSDGNMVIIIQTSKIIIPLKI